VQPVISEEPFEKERSMLRRLLSRTRKILRPSAGRAAGSPAGAPRCEALEPRLLLASGSGDVIATLVGGNLYITGDAENNYITVKDAGLGNGRLTVDPNGTTVNGSSSDWTTPTPVTGNIIIRMNGGNDTLRLIDFTAPRALTADLGEGENQLIATNVEFGGQATLRGGGGPDGFTLTNIAAVSNVSILGGGGGGLISLDTTEFMKNLSITNGSGGAADDFDATDTVIHGNLSVNNGNGGSSLNFNVDTGTAAVDGNVTFVAGEGSDYANFTGATIGGRISCDFGLGSGDHGLSLSSTSVDGSVSTRSLDGYGFVTVNDSEVGGSVSVDSRKSQEYIGVTGGSTVGGNVSMTTVGGENSFQLSGGTIDGNVSVTSVVQGSVNIDNSGGSAWVKGNVTFTSRTGNDQFRVSSAKIDGNIKVDSGTGGSQFNADDGALLVGKVSISSRSGNAMVAFNNGVAVLGATKINLGSGGDTVAINDSDFSGLVTINTGSGYDNLSIEEGGDTDGPTTRFFAGLRANTGSGDDRVAVGDYGADERAGDFRAPSRIDGGDGTDTLFALHLADGSLDPVVVNFELTP
jgi:hypothetical protein